MRLKIDTQDFGFQVYKDGSSSLDEGCATRAATGLFKHWAIQTFSRLEQVTLILRAPYNSTRQYAFVAKENWNAKEGEYVIEVSQQITGGDVVYSE